MQPFEKNAMSTRKSRLLVLTGVTGQKSGAVFAEYLAKNKKTLSNLFDGIRVICRASSNTANIMQLLSDAEICRGSFENLDFLEQSMKGADTVVHIAWVRKSRAIVDAAVRANVRRLILVHTTGIYSKYKKAGEEYRHIDAYVTEQCAEHGIVLTILRPTMIYGNRFDQNVIKFIRMVDKLPVMPIVNDARYALQPVHYKDLGKAYFDVLMNEEATSNKNYDLSGGEVIDLRDMLEVIGENLGKKVKFVSCPYFLAYPGAWFVHVLTLGKMDFREKVQRLCEPRAYSHEAAVRDFGYAPMTFREGIVDEAREYLERKRNGEN